MAGGAAQQLDLELLDPCPDIHALFRHYSQLYFGDALGACSVHWSSPRMTLCAGTCSYQDGGGCKIRLSQPLLQYRPSSDLKNTLLHEMIHALLFLTHNNLLLLSDHGPAFHSKMDSINGSNLEDCQRPLDGYQISVYHSFKDEVVYHRRHHWTCDTCGEVVKRAMNRAPSASDCRWRPSDGTECLDKLCVWHMHVRTCGGNFLKTAEPEGYVDRRKRAQVAGESTKKDQLATHAASICSPQGSPSGLSSHQKVDLEPFMSIMNWFRPAHAEMDAVRKGVVASGSCLDLKLDAAVNIKQEPVETHGRHALALQNGQPGLVSADKWTDSDDEIEEEIEAGQVAEVDGQRRGETGAEAAGGEAQAAADDVGQGAKLLDEGDERRSNKGLSNGELQTSVGSGSIMRVTGDELRRSVRLKKRDREEGATVPNGFGACDQAGTGSKSSPTSSWRWLWAHEEGDEEGHQGSSLVDRRSRSQVQEAKLLAKRRREAAAGDNGATGSGDCALGAGGGRRSNSLAKPDAEEEGVAGCRGEPQPATSPLLKGRPPSYKSKASVDGELGDGDTRLEDESVSVAKATTVGTAVKQDAAGPSHGYSQFSNWEDGHKGARYLASSSGQCEGPAIDEREGMGEVCPSSNGGRVRSSLQRPEARGKAEALPLEGEEDSNRGSLGRRDAVAEGESFGDGFGGAGLRPGVASCRSQECLSPPASRHAGGQVGARLPADACASGEGQSSLGQKEREDSNIGLVEGLEEGFGEVGPPQVGATSTKDSDGGVVSDAVDRNEVRWARAAGVPSHERGPPAMAVYHNKAEHSEEGSREAALLEGQEESNEGRAIGGVACAGQYEDEALGGREADGGARMKAWEAGSPTTSDSLEMLVDQPGAARPAAGPADVEGQAKCPICLMTFAGYDNEAVNEHVDECLLT
eukprot:SM000057S18386  [mRNA]  locus=s57:384778:389245:+ [translate_table: standard]